MKILPYLLKQPHKLSRTLLSTTTALSLYCGATFANTQDNLWKNSFEGGLDAHSYKYRESAKAWHPIFCPKDIPFFMQDKGMMYGVNGAYQLTYDESAFLMGEARWSHGRVDYKNCDGPAANTQYTPSVIFEARLLSGYLFHFADNLQIGPYTGVGYYDKRDDNRDCTGLNSYVGRHQRVNRVGYVPFGVRFNYTFLDKWSLSGFAEYDLVFKGQTLSYTNDSIPSPKVFHQKKGSGLRAEMLIGYQFEKAKVSFGPWVQYLKIDQSKIFNYEIQHPILGRLKDCRAVEPLNRTTIVAFTLKVQW